MRVMLTELINDSISSISLEERVNQQDLNNKINFLRKFVGAYRDNRDVSGLLKSNPCKFKLRGIK